MRHKKFTKIECFPRLNIDPLRETITNSQEFEFDAQSIVTLRVELRELILHLSELYLPWKKAQDLNAMRAKRLKTVENENRMADGPTDDAVDGSNLAGLFGPSSQPSEESSGAILDTFDGPSKRELNTRVTSPAKCDII